MEHVLGSTGKGIVLMGSGDAMGTSWRQEEGGRPAGRCLAATHLYKSQNRNKTKPSNTHSLGNCPQSRFSAGTECGEKGTGAAGAARSSGQPEEWEGTA